MLAYDIQGSGPGLVLLHGTSSTGAGSWGTLLDALAADHTVVLPDLPGSGKSPLPDGPLDDGHGRRPGGGRGPGGRAA